MSSGFRVAAQAGAVALVLGLLGLLAWKVAFEETAAASKGDVAPDFSLPRLDDAERELSLASLRGKVVVLNFWAAWCEPCREEAPILESTWRRYRDRGVVVLGIDSRDFRGDGQRFVREEGLTYPNVYDGPGRQSDRYRLTGFPETFVIDRSGRVRTHFAGPVEADELEAALERALA